MASRRTLQCVYCGRRGRRGFFVVSGERGGYGRRTNADDLRELDNATGASVRTVMCLAGPACRARRDRLQSKA